MSTHFGKEKFHLALMSLVSPGDIHSRVTAALAQHLFHVKEDEDLPEQIRSEFKRFHSSLNVESVPSGHISDVINNMSETEVEKVAQNIVALQEKLLEI